MCRYLGGWAGGLKCCEALVFCFCFFAEARQDVVLLALETRGCSALGRGYRVDGVRGVAGRRG